MQKQHAMHGRDHSPVGMDPQQVGQWHYVGGSAEPAFLNGWGNMAATVDVPDPVPLRFRLNTGVPNRVGTADPTDTVVEYRDHELEIQGDIDGGAEDTVVFVLPAMFRLAYDAPLPGHDVDGTYVGSRLLADGSFIRGHAVGGSDGADGADGAPGVGVPVGGSTGNMLVKQSGADYDTAWAAVHDVPSGGTTGQSLTKQSNTNYDTVWATVTGGSGWHDGSGAPSSGLGANGDYYLDDDTGDIYLKASGTWSKVTAGARIGDLLVTVDNNGTTITTGVKGDIPLDFAGQILAWTLLADVSGSIQLDLWKDVYGSYPPTVADTITASAKPLISSTTKAQSSTLTGWTTTFSSGDTIRVNVDSCTSITRVTLALKVKRT